MKKLFLFLALLIPMFILQAQDNKTKARDLGLKAIEIMDNGDIDEAIRLLQQAHELDPETHLYLYELGYAFYAKKSYSEAIGYLEKSTKCSDANDQCYQLLGNAYDLNNERSKAMQAYEDGLRLFPNSGKIRLEKGLVYMDEKKYDEAMKQWEEGIRVEPTFPSNYYWATKFYCNSNRKYWGFFYGEIFRALEINSKRTAEISRMLYDTYNAGIEIKSRKKMTMDFGGSVISLNNLANPEKFKLPFGMVYEMTLITSFAGDLPGKEKSLNIAALHKLRERFVKKWFDEKKDKEYPNMLLDWHKRMVEEKHFEAYNYWLLMQGNPDEFTAWYQNHKSEYKAFSQWITQNPIPVSSSNYFHSAQYDN